MRCFYCPFEAFLIRALSENGDHCATRTYRCKHGHDTTTAEVPPSGVSKRDTVSAVRRAEANAAQWLRDQAILKDLSSMSASAIGRKYGLTCSRVRQIRDEVRLSISKDGP